MAELPLYGKRGAGKVTLIDDSDFPALSGYRFYLHRSGYALTYLPREGQKRPAAVTLHLLLRTTKDGLYADHINGEKLDNRRSNLRPATPQENAFNQKINCNNKSGYKGVRKLDGRWQAQIHKDGRQYYLGSYPTPALAAAAYNGAATVLYGAFARPNDLSELDCVG